jgi:hypothetical protein
MKWTKMIQPGNPKAVPKGLSPGAGYTYARNLVPYLVCPLILRASSFIVPKGKNGGRTAMIVAQMGKQNKV